MILRKYSTIKIGGEVQKFLRLAELEARPELWLDLPDPIRILGNGSNTLIDDRGLKGTVILTRSDQPLIEELQQRADVYRIRVSSGSYLPSLAKRFAREGWSGTEFMVGVPGTLGGAIVQNAGANQQEIKDIVVEILALNRETRELKNFSAAEAGFGYRTSYFKFHPEWLILSGVLELRRREVSECENQLALNLNYRKEKTPWAKPSLGSMYTRLPGPEVGTWLYPGQLIEACGLKNLQIGQAIVSDLHANYFINLGQASFEDMYQLMLKVESEVFQQTGIQLHREVDLWSDHIPPQQS